MKTSSARVYCDDEGTWWARNSDGSRARCLIGKCCYCGEDFASFPQSRKATAARKIPMHCTQRCYFTCRNNGGHPQIRPLHEGRENSHRWKGGRIQRRGYWLIFMPEHHTILASKAKTRKYVLEHRVIMEGILGRNLLPSETVHHINGDGLDNRPENLQVRSGNHGQGVVHQCLDCGSTNVTTVKIAG